jgi:hypothetical protein
MGVLQGNVMESDEAKSDNSFAENETGTNGSG